MEYGPIEEGINGKQLTQTRVVWEQWGFISETNTTRAKDICLDTEQNICHLEMHPSEIPETVMVYIGKGYVCMGLWDFIFVGTITGDTNIHSLTHLCLQFY